jgi:hypothetical protein
MRASDSDRLYPEPDGDDGFLYVREWEDERLVDEYLFLTRLVEATASEVAFRADNPEHRDDTGGITAADVQAYEVADAIREGLPNLDYGPDPDEND